MKITERQRAFFEQHREQIYHTAEQWGISVVLRLTELQHGTDAAIKMILDEARKRGVIH